MNDGLISRDLTQDDCFRLPELLRNVWKIKTTQDYWRWKYFDTPFETKGMLIENSEGHIIAFSGYWIKPTRFGGKNIMPATLLDLMVVPEYRGGKPFRTIYKRIRSEILIKHVTFGFTNPVSYTIFRRLFRKNIIIDTNIFVFHSLVRAGSYFSLQNTIGAIVDRILRFVYKLRLGWHFNNKIFVEQTDNIGDDFDCLWKDIQGEYFWIQCRGKEYLRWRYLLHPIIKYQIWKAMEADRLVGYLVTTINHSAEMTKGIIIDWFVSRRREDVFKEMVKSAFKWLIDQHVDLVEIHLMNHEKQWTRILRSFFFFKGKNARSFILSGGTDERNPNFLKIENFFFTLGDSDYLGTTDI